MKTELQIIAESNSKAEAKAKAGIALRTKSATASLQAPSSPWFTNSGLPFLLLLLLLLLFLFLFLFLFTDQFQRRDMINIPRMHTYKHRIPDRKD
jgi:hypothetical protein